MGYSPSMKNIYDDEMYIDDDVKIENIDDKKKIDDKYRWRVCLSDDFEVHTGINYWYEVVNVYLLF